MTSQRKSERQSNHQKLSHVPYFNYQDTQDIKTRKGQPGQEQYFCAKAINIKQDIAHNPKTDNTGINKHSIKYKALDIQSISAFFRSSSNEFKANKLKHYLNLSR